MFYSFKRTHTHAHMSDKSISHESSAYATSKRTQKCSNRLESFTTTQLIIFMSFDYARTNILRFTNISIFQKKKMYKEKMVASEKNYIYIFKFSNGE